ncbi:nucleoside deaminase [Anaerospora sp.]|jgi:tRNA(Arg) A34 adenosine deaminase TadA|uniref:nucleoside deaminase n=1 Tax=Anaerospora sp. TaxID=1960278 RepID=UPI00289F40D1|nr:nucleoside deaminase [Anaerospora sp.]MDF2929967.1 Cytosine/adenosine deaminase [Anaerospora sp.]
MPHQSAIDYLRQAISVSKKSREHGNTPFGAILVDSEGTVILEQENIEITQSNCTGHAETTLMEAASQRYSKSFLWNCTLYTTAEPCAMCSGAIYWGNVGKVVYGISEERLLTLTGDNEQNPTFNLPCREVFRKGQKQITVVGPFPELEDEIVAVHEGYWK